jgi:hypothetical protein
MQTKNMKNPIHPHRTLSLFDFRAPREKGSREWSTFSAVREDRLGAYRVATPRKPLVVRGPSRILRIIAPHYHHQSNTLRSAH